MTLFTLKYQWQNHEDSIEILEEGILYLDLSEPKIRAYSNPTDGPMATLTITRKKIFLNFEGRAHELGSSPVTIGALTLSAIRNEEFAIDVKKYLHFATGLIQRYWKKPVVLGGFGLCLILTLLVFSFNSKKNSKSKNLEQELHNMESDLSTEELLKRRLTLAQYYLNEKNYVLCLDLAEKILAVQPDHATAIEIKEKALSQLGQAKTDAQKTLKKELRIKSLLDNAVANMSRKDFLSAKLTLEQVLEDHPDHAEAHRMKEDIQKELDKIEEQKKEASTAEQDKIKNVEVLWKKGKELFEEQKYVEAYLKLSEASGIVKLLHFKPAFDMDLKDLLRSTETHLNDRVRPIVEKARQARNSADSLSELAQIRSYQDALTFYFEAEALFANYPLLQDEINLTLKKFDNALTPQFVEAQTIQGLEGCCAAAPYLQKILTLAKFERVSRYAKAKELLNQCPCR